MGLGILRIALARVALLTALATWSTWLAKAVADEPAVGKLEVKHVDGDGRVSVETPAQPAFKAKNRTVQRVAAKSSSAPKSKLYVFAEDEADEAAAEQPAATSQPATAAVPKSNFQPRFRAPAARRVAHTEPIETGPSIEPATGTEPAAATKSTAAVERATRESAEPKLEPIPSKVAEPTTDPKQLLDEAYAKSKTAKTESDYSDLIGRCRRAGQLGLAKNYEEYSHRLMAWAYNRRGEARAKEKKDAEALSDFEAAVTLNPDAWRAVHNRGVSYAAVGKVIEAMADFQRTLELNDHYPNAFYNRGQLRAAQSNFPGAIEDYSAALQLGSPDAAMLNDRGHAFYRLERFGEALRDYATALDLDPKNAATLINRGDVYCDLGRFSEAAKDYQAAVNADPKSGRAYQAVAWLMATCSDEHYRNDKLAIEAARKALTLDGEDNYRDLETLAAAQANAGEFADAKTTQEKAIAKMPRTELVTAEKRMGLYQRDLAYRERPKPDYAKPEDEDEKEAVRKASAAEKRAAAREKGPRRLPSKATYPFER